MDARAVAEAGGWVMHLATGVVGKAEKFYDGEQFRYFPAPNAAPVTAPVLKLHQGHAFVCSDPDALVELTTAEVAFYVEALALLETALTAAVMRNAGKVGADRGVQLLHAALAAQLNELRKRGAS